MPLLVARRTQGYLMVTMRAAPVVVTEGLAMALRADVKMGQTYPRTRKSALNPAEHATAPSQVKEKEPKKHKGNWRQKPGRALPLWCKEKMKAVGRQRPRKTR
jgi:hypothetical protein